MNHPRHRHYRDLRHEVYSLVVYAAGVATVLVAALTARVPRMTLHWAAIVTVLALFVVLGELFPISIRRGDTVELYTFSTTAALALIVIGPIWIAMLALLPAALLRDIFRRRPFYKNAFNLARCAVSLLLARLIYNGLAYHHILGYFTPHFEARDVGPALVAGLAYFLINICLIACVFALHQGASAFGLLPEFMKSEALMGLTLIAVGPIVLLALMFTPWIAPLCLVPVLAVRAGALSAAKRELQALHDQLTGLPNRTLLTERVGRALGSVTQEAMGAVVIVDLDRFKEINDAMGYSVGDQLLQQVAAKLLEVVRPGDTVARLGGDEFAVFCRGVRDDCAALQIGNRALAALTGVIELGGVNLRVEASAGVALSPVHASDVDSLLRRAEVALSRAKRWRRSSAVLYDQRSDEGSVERLTLMGELCNGLEDELVVYYQPKCRLSDGAIVGVEALVRWQHPTFGLLAPARFIDAAEKSGLILPLTVQVFRQALQQWRSWEERGLDLSIAINVSAESICDPAFPAELRRVFADLSVPRGRFLVEVTETSTVTDLDAARSVLAQLREIGLDISIDDFGTGHSSLAHIRDLGPVEVKIDRSFVASSTESDRDLALIRAATELGHGLGMVVVAEGVETPEQLSLVADVGCDLAQGFFILPPVTADEVASWVSRPQVWSRYIPTTPAIAANELTAGASRSEDPRASR